MPDLLAVIEQLWHVGSGDHNILIFPNLIALRTIYSHYCKMQIEEKNEIVLLLSSYDCVNSVMHYLREFGIDVERYKKNGFLMVSSASKLFVSEPAFLDLIDFNEKHLKNHGRKGITIIFDMGALCHIGKTNEIMDIEKLITATYDIRPASILCSYQQSDFDALTEEQKNTLISLHSKKLIVTDIT
jgi:hypothetical protein